MEETSNVLFSIGPVEITGTDGQALLGRILEG